MKKAFVFVLVLVLVFSVMVSVISVANCESTITHIRIRSDGNVEPADSPIVRDGDVYRFISDVFSPLVVDRDNVIIDGAGYTLQGTYNGTRTDDWVVGEGPNQAPSDVPWTIGIDIASRDRYNLTVRNLNIKNFYIGMYIWSSNNTITGNAVTDNIVGILLSGDNNTITQNYIAQNEEGIFFGVNTPGNEPLDIVMVHNSFVDNAVQFSGCFCETYDPEEAVHTWDDGSRGNFWSDYTGVDIDEDGIGDTPYVIDAQNQDRYPLMQMEANPPTSESKASILIVAAVLTLLVMTIAVVVTYRSLKKTKSW